MPLVRRNGKFLSVGGKLSTTADCCCQCGNCPLPDCDCPHAISCEIKFDSSDTSAQDFLELMDSDDNGFGIFYEPGFSNISIYNIPANEQLDVAVPGTFFDTWHSVCVQFCRSDDTHVNVTLTIDGASGSMEMEIPSSVFAPRILYAGARLGGGDAHRSLRCVSALGTEGNFNFPSDSFTSLTGAASVVDDTLRIDSTAGTDAYGEEDLSHDYSLSCTGPLCSTVVSFTYQSSADEGASGYIFQLLSCGFWPDYTNNRWQLDGVSTDVTLPFVGTIIGVPHDVSVVWRVNDDDTIDNYFVVDGVTSAPMNDPASLFDDGSGFLDFKIGSVFPDTITHRQITDFTIAENDPENFPDGIVFKFPDDATTDCTDPTKIFYTTTGSDITISGSTISVDNETGAPNYLGFDYAPGGACVDHPSVPARCCCTKYLDMLADVSTIKLDFSITGLCSCGDITQTKTWNRVPADTVPADNEFRLLCDPNSDRRLQLDAGGPPSGHGDALRIIVDDYPNPADTLQIDVVMGVFSGPPDFDPPACGWSVKPCITSGLTCVSVSSWDTLTTYVTNQLTNYLSTIYISLQDGNLNHNPASATDWWAVFSPSPCTCAQPTFCLDTTLLAIEDVIGVHTYSDTRSCPVGSYDIEWKVTVS